MKGTQKEAAFASTRLWHKRSAGHTLNKNYRAQRPQRLDNAPVNCNLAFFYTAV